MVIAEAASRNVIINDLHRAAASMLLGIIVTVSCRTKHEGRRKHYHGLQRLQGYFDQQQPTHVSTTCLCEFVAGVIHRLAKLVGGGGGGAFGWLLLGRTILTPSAKGIVHHPNVAYSCVVRKLDFSHHDSPAAMFAVYDASAGRGEHAEAAAKGAQEFP